MRHASRHCRGLPLDNMMVNSGGILDVFSDHLHTAIRNIRNRAVTRQRPGSELDLCDPAAQTAFASTSIYQHIEPFASSQKMLVGTPNALPGNCWNLAS